MKTKPFAHQAKEIEETWSRKFWGLFWEMGTGKTKVILDTAIRLHQGGEIDGMLVMTYKGCYRNWLSREIPTHVPDNYPMVGATYAAGMRKKDAYSVEMVCAPPAPDTLDVLAMNVEALVSETAFKTALKFLNSHRVLFVIDESSCIKNPRAQRTKKILKLARLARYRRIMTGTPVTEGPLGLWSQMEFLEPGLSQFRTFTEYRSFYSVIVNRKLANGREFPDIVGERNMDHLQDHIPSFSSRLLKKDCLDLPEKIFQTYDVEHTPEQAKAYKDLKNNLMLELDNGSIVNAAQAITMMVKLKQINCGFLKDIEGNITRIPSNRTGALLEVMEQISGKGIIWGVFHEDMRQIWDAVSSTYGKESAVLYYGEVSDADRADALDRFRRDPKTRWFIANPAVGGMSLTLTEASDSIYYSVGFSLEQRLQSEDRTHRIGQRNVCNYTDLVTPRTIDTKVLNALRQKKKLSDFLLKDIRELLTEEEG